MDVTTGVKRGFPYWAAPILFLLLSLTFIPYAGLHADESLFAGPLYLPADRQYSITIFHHPVRLMLMSYLGTLKTLFYWPVLSFFGGNVWSVRIPVAVAGGVTVGLF